MTEDTKTKMIYSESKLVKHLTEELSNPNPNYSTCLKYMKNLGQLSASKDKEIDDATCNSFFKSVSTILRNADKSNSVPLGLRIISLKVLTNLCIALNVKQHNNQSRVAYSLIIKEIGNEIKKPNFSVVFLITIFDAIYLCSQANCIDDKDTIKEILSLSQIANNLGSKKESLAIALDIDLQPFFQNYKSGAQTKDLNSVLQQIGCSKLQSDTQKTPAFNIPPPQQITNLEMRLAAQNFLVSLNPEKLADRVIEGFKDFKSVDNYKIPDHIEDLFQTLLDGPENQDQKSLNEEAIK